MSEFPRQADRRSPIRHFADVPQSDACGSKQPLLDHLVAQASRRKALDVEIVFE
jgi:hypothetical protein